MMTQMKRLYNEKGVHRFYITGAVGVHMWAGELALQLKSQPGYGNVELAVVLPFPGYDSQWDVKSRKRMDSLIRNSAECVTIGQAASQKNYIRSNIYLVDRAQFLIAVSDHTNDSPQNLNQIVSRAVQKHLDIIFIHPDTAEADGVF